MNVYIRRHMASKYVMIKIVCGPSEGDSVRAGRASWLSLIPRNAWPQMRPHQWNWRSNSWSVPGWTFNHEAAYSHLDIEIFYPLNLLSVLFFLTQSQSEIVKWTNLKSCIAWDLPLLVCPMWAWRRMGGIIFESAIYSWGAFLKNSYRDWQFPISLPLSTQLPQHWSNRVFTPLQSSSWQVRVWWVKEQNLRTS